MERMSSIELALKNEEIEMKFYLREASRSNNALAKAMFDELAKDEEEHMQRIRGLHGELVSKGAWPVEMPIEVAGTNISQVLDGVVRRGEAAESHDDDDMAALRRAIDFEARGAAFYAELAGACDNPAERTFFEFLAGIEREHHLSLTESVAYLEDPAAWMMEQGRGGLDGA